MRPLVCTNKPTERQDAARRRSKRKREADARASRFAFRCEPAELAAWIAAASALQYLSVSDWVRDRLNAAARLGVHFSSNFVGWNTPRFLLTLIRRAFGRHSITLDPCSNAKSIVRARTEWAIEDDAFASGRDWFEAAAGGLIYVNPPYGKEINRWMVRCAQVGAMMVARGGLGVFTLVPARTDAAWFRRATATASAFILWPGRMRFLGAPSTAPFPVALIYWGRHVETFASIAPEHVYRREQPRGAPARTSATRSRPAPITKIGELRKKGRPTTKIAALPARGANASRSFLPARRGAA